MKKNISQGSHYLISFWGCNHEQIESVNFWKKILTKSASEAKLIVLGSIYHKFNPHGITGILLLSSSHFLAFSFFIIALLLISLIIGSNL